jgi:hypothetical protein
MARAQSSPPEVERDTEITNAGVGSTATLLVKPWAMRTLEIGYCVDEGESGAAIREFSQTTGEGEAAMQLGMSLTALRRAPKRGGYWINCELRRARNPERSSVTKSATSAAPESARSCASR